MQKVIAIGLGLFWQWRNPKSDVILSLSQLFVKLFEIVEAALYLIHSIRFVEVFKCRAGFDFVQCDRLGPRLFDSLIADYFYVN